jgi:hypothetical protein
MDGRDNIQTLLALRKLTRAVADSLRAQMVEYLATLTPLLRPKAVLGDYVAGGMKEPARRADKAFKELQSLYEAVATAKPFNLPREIKPPIDVPGLNLEVSPFEYLHVATANGETRPINVRSPLTWVLSYSGFAPARLKELVQAKTRANDEIQQYVLSFLAIHVVTSHQPGLLQMLDALHFPISTSKSDDLGGLPITCIRASISTSRPADDLIVESAALTGMDAFEEVLNVQDITNLRNPQRERLLEILRGHAPELAPAS